MQKLHDTSLIENLRVKTHDIAYSLLMHHIKLNITNLLLTMKVLCDTLSEQFYDDISVSEISKWHNCFVVWIILVVFNEMLVLTPLWYQLKQFEEISRTMGWRVNIPSLYKTKTITRWKEGEHNTAHPYGEGGHTAAHPGGERVSPLPLTLVEGGWAHYHSPWWSEAENLPFTRKRVIYLRQVCSM